MYKKTVTYEDYNGLERTEDFYFNFNKAELIEMNLTVEGGLPGMVDRIVKAKDQTSIVKIFKDLVCKAYGVKADDGKRFKKSEEITREFIESPAYSIIFMELAFDDVAAAEFVNGIIPSDLADELRKLQNKGQTPSA